MSNHTQGPWEIVHNQSNNYFVRHPLNHEYREAGYFVEIRRFTTDEKVLKANANLVAAAPDMLAALRVVASHFDSYVVEHELESIVRQAIDKAEGNNE